LNKLVGIRKILFTLAVIAGLGGLVLAGVLAIGRSQEVSLPVPPGPFAVGRVMMDWTDTNRADPLGHDPRKPRKLNVWIWYPAEKPAEDALPAPYLPAAWVQARQRDAGLGLLLRQDLARVHSHSYPDLPLASAREIYPLLILQPGLGPILPDYTTLAEALASSGYIVVGSTPTGSASVVAFNDGEVISGTTQGNISEDATPEQTRRILGSLVQVWAEDNRFVLDQAEQLNLADPAGRFTGRIDLTTVGVFGHSFGGASAAQFCHLEPRCKAGADLDGYLYGDVVDSGLAQPFLFVWSQPVDARDPAWLQASADAQAVFDRLPAGSLKISLRDTRHFNFTDNAVEFDPLMRPLGLLGPIDGARGLYITTSYLQAFFDNALLHHRDPLLDANPSPFPEAQVEVR
jgi:hypothetical protein